MKKILMLIALTVSTTAFAAEQNVNTKTNNRQLPNIEEAPFIVRNADTLINSIFWLDILKYSSWGFTLSAAYENKKDNNNMRYGICALGANYLVSILLNYYGEKGKALQKFYFQKPYLKDGLPGLEYMSEE